MPIFMKDGEIHVSGFAEGSDGAQAEAGEGTVLALHEAGRTFEYAPTPRPPRSSSPVAGRVTELTQLAGRRRPG